MHGQMQQKQKHESGPAQHDDLARTESRGVPHLHGGNTQQGSDGHPEAWWTSELSDGPSLQRPRDPLLERAVCDDPVDSRSRDAHHATQRLRGTRRILSDPR